ncbi:hypothetical protein MUB18_17730 [Sphingobacterium sp. PCS056]|uniref:hypothetical protein n=1 Tax=Sphingobacterium sp. PCS056 TaxID=2931400 RepID=UPI00200BA5FE|nr:hypothetical protein [Sphingobacterium sp. PCS056]UPZ35947.1 hypothetical protein MUB18_17730 [Sphingobacterium sp. PCS056]
MRRTKTYAKKAYRIFIGLLSVLFVLLYSSCSSISPKYLAKTADDYTVSKIVSQEVYTFDNFPLKIGNRINPILEKSSKENADCLWNFIEPGYYKRDSLQFLYETSLELISKNKILFKLIDTVGHVVRKKIIKIRSEPQNFISFRKTDVDIYILLNRFISTTSCFAIAKNGELIVSSETTAAGFLVFFPFAGNQDIATNTYKRIVIPSFYSDPIAQDLKKQF